MSDLTYVPDRFKRVVILHVVKQLLRQDIGRLPLLLGIHGRPGNGKTYQCELILEELGARTFLISGGQLESASAGEPARLIRDSYLAAGRCLERGEASSAVILINDADTALGDWGERVQYTVNRQTVYGELMHLADYPTSVEGRDTPRIPILLTGNDFTRLYEPLIRAGRMTTFQWEPTPEERAAILTRIFPEVSPAECQQLGEHLDQAARQVLSPGVVPLPVSFFAHMKSTLYDDLLWQVIEATGLQKTLGQIQSGYEPRLKAEVGFTRLLQTGLHLIKSDPRDGRPRPEGGYNQLLQSGLQLFKSGPFVDQLRSLKDGRNHK